MRSEKRAAADSTAKSIDHTNVSGSLSPTALDAGIDVPNFIDVIFMQDQRKVTVKEDDKNSTMTSKKHAGSKISITTQQKKERF